MRVQSLQFCSSVVDFELPIDRALFGVGLVGPDSDLGLKQRQFADAAARQTLAVETTEFAFGDVQPTAVFGGVVKLDLVQNPTRLLRPEGLVELAPSWVFRVSFTRRIFVARGYCWSSKSRMQ